MAASPAAGAVHAPPRGENGTGQVRFDGRGPEAWHWAFVVERRRRAELEQRLERRWRPTALYAYRLASVVYGVSMWELRSVGACESGHNPFARNGRYRGLMQEGPMFERGPYGRAGFNVYDPVANVLTAAHTVEREGWRQWECRP